MSARGDILSSDTFFHFTSSLENLKGILNHTFKPRYCLESTNYLNRELEEEMAYPMVCFCDIPLSKLKTHMSQYGSYGIGLKRSWGFKNGFSPIIYTRRGSTTAKAYSNLIKIFKNHEGSLLSDTLISKEFSSLLMHTKPFSGSMRRNNKNIRVRFYDEKEWRWIPDTSNSDSRNHLEREEYNNPELIREQNEHLANRFRLRFGPEDINYLILNSETEIDEFIHSLDRIKDGFDSRTKRKLTSRILTKERIVKDF